MAALWEAGVLGTEADIAVRVPADDEIRPDPGRGEVVLFVDHLERGLALPVSPFFRQFLDYFNLQPHHLGANSIAQLSFFATLYEAYLGIRPSLDLFCRFFFIRGRQKSFADGRTEPVDCGSAVVYKRPKSVLLAFKTLDSIKGWQRTYFYVRNKKSDEDRVGLPAFSFAPSSKANWDGKGRPGDKDVDAMVRRVDEMVKEGLQAADLTICWLYRRVCPLQSRAHKI